MSGVRPGCSVSRGGGGQAGNHDGQTDGQTAGRGEGAFFGPVWRDRRARPGLDLPTPCALPVRGHGADPATLSWGPRWGMEAAQSLNLRASSMCSGPYPAVLDTSGSPSGER